MTRDNQIAFMVDEKLKEEIENIADSNSLSISEIARRGLLEEKRKLEKP